MRFVLYADSEGLERVIIEHAVNDAQDETHKLFDSIRPEIERFGEAVKTAVKNLRAPVEDRPFEKERVLGK